MGTGESFLKMLIAVRAMISSQNCTGWKAKKSSGVDFHSSKKRLLFYLCNKISCTVTKSPFISKIFRTRGLMTKNDAKVANRQVATWRISAYLENSPQLERALRLIPSFDFGWNDRCTVDTKL